MRSMTAFARQDVQASWGSLTCEIRTVNHRYLEPGFRLPDALRDLENAFREKLREHLKRGKVDVAFRLSSAESESHELTIDEAMIHSVNDAVNRVNKVLDNPAHISALDILRWPGVMAAQEPDNEPAREAALPLFEKTLEDLMAAREAEGDRLAPLFSDRLTTIKSLVAEVRQQMPELLEAQEAQLRERIARAGVEVDPDRLTQELVIIAQKSDVAEELDRLEAHVQEVEKVLDSDSAIGRRLDFLMQELNREANTLSSKSIGSSVTRAAVDLKVLIEQMREQVQNVE